jgi:hypothetical protein
MHHPGTHVSQGFSNHHLSAVGSGGRGINYPAYSLPTQMTIAQKITADLKLWQKTPPHC